MTVADASVWIAALLRQDAHHRASRGWLQQVQATQETVSAPVLLLSEVAGAVARRRADRQAGRDAAEQLRRTPALRLVPVGYRSGALAARLAAELQLRGADATYVALAYELGAPLVSWDAEHLQRGGSLISTRTP